MQRKVLLVMLISSLLIAALSIMRTGDHSKPAAPGYQQATTTTAATSYEVPVRVELARNRVKHQHVVLQRRPRVVRHSAPPLAPHRVDQWVNSSKARSVRQCESGGDYTLVDSHTGTAYYGAWQADADFWTTYAKQLRHPEWVRYLYQGHFTAPRWMQNLIAYTGWLARGWQPWACA